MEEIDKKIQAFLDIGDGDGSGDGYGDGSGDGSGSGSSSGSSSGSGDGYGDGYGYGYGSGYGSGSGDGYGYGSGDGSGYGDGYGSGSGDGDGDGDGSGSSSGSSSGSGDGYGDGYGYGYGSGDVNGKKIYNIDGVETVIDSVRGNVAKGAIFNRDFTFTPCFIVKENSKFAHGRTLHEAFASLQEKLFDGATEEERLQTFKKKFPEFDTPYNNSDLYHYHHVLTGSCEMGRNNFKEQHGLSLDGKMTVREFVVLTKDAYGGDVIKKLPIMYKR